MAFENQSNAPLSLGQELAIESLPFALSLTAGQCRKLWTRREKGAYRTYELLEKVAECLSQTRIGEVFIKEIFVDTKKLWVYDNDNQLFRNPENDNELLTLPLERLVCGGCISQIVVETGHPDFTPSVAVNQILSGEEIAIGLNTRICSNFAILQSDRLFKNDGNPLDELLKWLRKSLLDMQDKFQRDLNTIEQLKTQKVLKKDFEAYLGREFRRIEKCNHFRLNRKIRELPKIEKDLILTGRQLGLLALQSVDPSHAQWGWENDMTNKWNILNWATEVLKLQRGADITKVLGTNQRFTQELLQYDFSK